jgi:hypothetical protein
MLSGIALEPAIPRIFVIASKCVFKGSRIMNFRNLLAALAASVSLVTVSWAQQMQYSAVLNGAAEAPPNDSTGTGTALLTFDMDASTMRVEATFDNLVGNVTAAHIHCCTTDAGAGTVGVATPTPTFPGFPSGVTSGTYDMTFDLTQTSSYNGAFVTANGGTAGGAMSALIAGVDSGKAYLNIHTSNVAGGEIRGFWQPVPEPASCTLLLLGIGVVAAARRR